MTDTVDKGDGAASTGDTLFAGVFDTTVYALLVTVGLLLLGIGLLNPLLGARAQIAGFSTAVIGGVMAMRYVGYIAGGLLIPKILAVHGRVKTFRILAVLLIGGVLLYPLSVNPGTWLLLQFGVGAIAVGLFATIESWLNSSVTNKARGRLLSIYLMVFIAGEGGGALLLGIGDPGESALFFLVGILVGISMVPLVKMKTETVHIVKPLTKVFLTGALRASPLGVLTLLVSGISSGVIVTLGAVYIISDGMSSSLAGIFVAVSVLGALLTQYPIGWISDRISRELLICILSGGAVITAAAMMVTGSMLMVFSLAAIYGSMITPLYTLSVAVINDHLTEKQRIAAAASILLIFGAGAIIGPILVSGIMYAVGPSGYLWGLLIVPVPILIYAAGAKLSELR